MKRLMRRALVEKKFDEDILAPIEDNLEQPDRDADEMTTVKFLADEGASTYEIR